VFSRPQARRTWRLVAHAPARQDSSANYTNSREFLFAKIRAIRGLSVAFYTGGSGIKVVLEFPALSRKLGA